MAERRLALLLRIQAAMLLCAVPAVFLPTGWMDAVHQALGMGELPRAPLVEYLTRSISALYACWGLLLLVMAHEVRRYLPLVRLLAGIEMTGGGGLLLLDLLVGMPVPWIVVEGPLVLLLGVTTWLLARTVPPSDSPHG